MDDHASTFDFSDIDGPGGSGSFRLSSEGAEARVGIAVSDQTVTAASDGAISSIEADLIDLAVAVYVADRFALRRGGYPRRIRCILPLRNPEVFGEADALRLLHDLLYWYTGDRWQLEFSLRVRPGRASEQQLCLPFRAARDERIEAALWSGGLDSLAGLYNRLSVEPGVHYLLVGAGASSVTFGVQRRVAERAGRSHPGRTGLIQVPIEVGDTEGLRRDSLLRARGAVFLLVGVAVATHWKQRTLFVYENGVGALNLPFRGSEVGWDHSRAVHPLSLFYVSEWISKVTGQAFRIHNPFLFATKSQMCEILTKDGLSDDALETVSCDSVRREPGGAVACGYCSSCILRRQALVSARIDHSGSYRDRQLEPARSERTVHLNAMRRQVATLTALLSESEPWLALTRCFPVLADTVDQTAGFEGVAASDMIARLVNLYRRYTREWDAIAAMPDQLFLNGQLANSTPRHCEGGAR